MKGTWEKINKEIRICVSKEPILSDFFEQSVLNHASLDESLAFILAKLLSEPSVTVEILKEIFLEVFCKDKKILEATKRDLLAVLERDSACNELHLPLLYFKGFHALQIHRIAHWLWIQNRKSLALYLQNRTSCICGADIHPAAQLGSGIMLDHATGLVIGETSVVGNDVSILQSVTLGGTGKQEGDRHPKIGNWVLISAGAKILGNITIGDGAKVGAGSVVLKDVPAHTTVAGVPAISVGKPSSQQPAAEMDHDFEIK